MLTGLRDDNDVWLREYDDAKQSANDILTLIQARLGGGCGAAVCLANDSMNQEVLATTR